MIENGVAWPPRAAARSGRQACFRARGLIAAVGRLYAMAGGRRAGVEDSGEDCGGPTARGAGIGNPGGAARSYP
jgi:hypothetical protein